MQPTLRRTRLWQFTVSTRLARLMLPLGADERACSEAIGTGDHAAA
jgi:hypothetical protein